MSVRKGFNPRQKHILLRVRLFVSVGMKGLRNSSAAMSGKQQQGLSRSEALLIFVEKSSALSCGMGRKENAFLQ